jgi:hypothetical protein
MTVVMDNKTKFQCHHCKKKFLQERAFMNHQCPEMKKAEILKTVEGQAAYIHYSYWLKKKGRKAPPIDTFLHSTYFRSFLNFVEFAKDVSLPNTEKYIDIMCEKEIAPLLWPRSECYSMYLQWYDNKYDPIQQVNESVNTIFDFAEKLNIAPEAFFQMLSMRDIIYLVQQRKLSPWFLLCSKKFKEKLTTADDDDTKQLMKLIGINYWALKLEENDDVVQSIKQITTEMGL